MDKKKEKILELKFIENLKSSLGMLLVIFEAVHLIVSAEQLCFVPKFYSFILFLVSMSCGFC
jgi:hypothetical protein